MRGDPTPEQLLGLCVLTPGGEAIGTVVDVGVSTWRQPKFLLVRKAEGEHALLRVDFGQVQDVGEQAIRLLAVPAVSALPA